MFLNEKRVYADIDDLYMKYNILLLYTRRKHQLLCMMYKRSKDLDMLPIDDGKRITRSSKKVKFDIDSTNITRVQNSPLYRGISLWNLLPEYISIIKPLNVIK